MTRLTAILFQLVALSAQAYAQPLKGDSWHQTRLAGKGTVTAFWDDIEPFIYRDKEGILHGVEYEIMESLKPWVRKKYNVDLDIEWRQAGSFDSIYHKVKNGGKPGLFGWSYYSITEEREKEVDFTPPYMPDLNVLITNNREPMYASSQEFISRLPQMTAYAQANTTMAEDIEKIRSAFFKTLVTHGAKDDYVIMQQVAENVDGFGYVPLSIYIVGLQKGIKVKRQVVLSSRRAGFAGVIPEGSDWRPMLEEYFSSPEFRTKAGAIVTRHLGSKVKDLVFDPFTEETNDSLHGVELVSLEKELVTKRLMDTALDVQAQRSYRNIIMVGLVFSVLLLALLYSRFRIKQKLNHKLHSKNNEITAQKEKIEQINQLLKMKLQQNRINPHFLFNSLNSIQYFIMGSSTNDTLTYINRFSSFLRKIMTYGDALHIDAVSEASVLEQYLWLEEQRFSDRFEYVIDTTALNRAHEVLPMITMSVVEDALYHRLLKLAPDLRGKLTVKFISSESNLMIEILDNGIRSGTSISAHPGMLDLDKRLELFNMQGVRIINRTFINGADSADGLNHSVLEIPQPLFTDQTFRWLYELQNTEKK